MYHNLADRVEELTLHFSHILSVVGAPGEGDMADAVYELLASHPYFQTHPENLKFLAPDDGTTFRKSVMAVVEGRSKNACAMVAHIDTVGVSDFGALQPLCTDPIALTEAFKNVKLDAEAEEDLLSGRYLFGRGVCDMKSGLSAQLALLERAASDPDAIDGTWVLGAVCDEEGGSAGMLSYVKALIELKKERGYDFRGVIDSDFMAPLYPGDENNYIYIGTVGKLMPAFYVVGKESHVGEAFMGLDANLLASALMRRIDMNPDYCDEAEGEITQPPVALRQRDLKPEYSVQTARSASVFFNWATHKSLPEEVLRICVEAAETSFREVIIELEEKYRMFCRKTGSPNKGLPWKSRVMTYEELWDAVAAEVPDLQERVNKALALWKEQGIRDERDLGTRLVELVHGCWSDKDPVIIVHFLPPYYPHGRVSGLDIKEARMIYAAMDAVKKTQTTYATVAKFFYPFISDLSYANAPAESATESLRRNMPGFGNIYSLPLSEMRKLGLPVVNIGPFGKDAHKFTERVEKEYAFSVVPELIYRTAQTLTKE